MFGVYEFGRGVLNATDYGRQKGSSALGVFGMVWSWEEGVVLGGQEYTFIDKFLCSSFQLIRRIGMEPPWPMGNIISLTMAVRGSTRGVVLAEPWREGGGGTVLLVTDTARDHHIK